MALAAAAAAATAALTAFRPAAAAIRPSASVLRRTSAPVSASLRRCKPLRLAVRRRPSGGGAGGATMLGTAAASYAAALADVAVSNNTLEATLADSEKIDQIFSAPETLSFFTNPTVPIETKLDTISDIAAKAQLQPHVVNFLYIIVDMNRIDIVKEIVKEFEVAYNKITGTEVAVVSSVVRLESQDLAQIAQAVQRLTGSKNVRIKTVIDPSLIAGFTVRYGPSGSKLIDMSVKKQLDEIKSQLDFSNISLI